MIYTYIEKCQITQSIIIVIFDSNKNKSAVRLYKTNFNQVLLFDFSMYQ